MFSRFARGARKVLSNVQDEFNNRVRGGLFNLRKEIKNSKFNSSSGAKDALSWLFDLSRAQDSKYTGLLEDGFMYTFRYITPKHAATLPYWDTNPLIICLGHYMAKNNELVEIGINMHLLPKAVREEALCRIFDMYNKRYKGQLYRKTQTIVPVVWHEIAANMREIGAEFAVRSYIPRLRSNTIRFKYEDWAKAIYVPSLGFSGTTVEKLQQEYMAFVASQRERTFNDVLASR